MIKNTVIWNLLQKPEKPDSMTLHIMVINKYS